MNVFTRVIPLWIFDDTKQGNFKLGANPYRPGDLVVVNSRLTDTLPAEPVQYLENDVCIGEICLVINSPAKRGINYTLVLGHEGKMCLVPYYALNFVVAKG